MTSIIISGRPNSEEMSECIIVAENIANMYPSSRFTIVLKSPKEWEKYCEDLCNLFGILKKTHPLILFSNGNKIGGAQEFFKLIADSFKYDKLIKKGNEYVLDIDPGEVRKLTQENTQIIEKEYFCRTKGNYIIDKINDKLDKIPDENFIKYYSKYNTIETDYTREFIDSMKVYVKYDNKFTPNPNDYIEYRDIMEQRPAYADKEKYNAYHEELRQQIELEKKLKREAEEEAKRKAEEEQRLKEEAMRAEEEKNDTEGNNSGRGKKDKKKKKEEEERKKKEEERKKKEEEERKKKEEEERKKKEEEEKKKKEEEEKLKTESGQGEGGENNKLNTESGNPEEQQPEMEEEKVIKYKRILFKCYSDFDIPYDKFNKELLIESFKDDNFELIINPYFTFFGETLINKIKDYEAPLLPEREEPIIEEEEEDNLQMIISPNDPTKPNMPNKAADNAKDKKDSKANNALNAENKKDSPLNTVTSNLSGKKEEKKQDNKNQPPTQTPPPAGPIIENKNEVIGVTDGKIGGPTKSTEPNTYRPNFTEDKIPKDEIVIKDYGRLPSLRMIQFGGEDLRFYQEYIPPYQLKEHIFNNTNLFNFSDDCNIIDKNTLVSVMQMINETNGYATYRVLPYNYSDWKKFSSNIIKIMPQKSKDLKNLEYPLVDKISQQINKYKRNLFENSFKEEVDKKNLELILHNEDFENCFSLPEFFTIDIYKKNNIPHLIKSFGKGTFIYANVKFAINKMCELLEINNKTGYGFCLILCKKFLFMAPIKEPYTYTKGQEENKAKNINASPRIPIFIEPHFFMGIYTLPYIESDWPESIKRKNVKFDLLDILKKSTN
jgi:hypothetical protein